MGVKHMDFVWEKIGGNGITACDKALLVCLGQRHPNKGLTWIEASTADMASWVRCSPKTIQRSLKRLEGHGLIQRQLSDGKVGFIGFGDVFWSNYPKTAIEIKEDANEKRS